MNNDSNKTKTKGRAGRALIRLGSRASVTAESGHDFFDQLGMFEKQFTRLNGEFQKLRCQRAFISRKTFNARARELRARNSQLCADVIRFME